MKQCICFLCLLLLSSALVRAAGLRSESEVKAEFILNFIDYFAWPDTALHGEAPLRLCVMEQDPVFLSLEKLISQSKNQHIITLREHTRRGSLDDCRVLYIGPHYYDDASYLIHITRGKAILTISDKPEFAAKGGMVGFSLTPVALHINLSTVKAAGMEVDGDLLEAGQVFK